MQQRGAIFHGGLGIGAEFDQSRRHFGVEQRQEKRRGAVVGGHVGLQAVGQQKLDRVDQVIFYGVVESGEALLVRRVQISAFGLEQLGNRGKNFLMFKCQ